MSKIYVCQIDFGVGETHFCGVTQYKVKAKRWEKAVAKMSSINHGEPYVTPMELDKLEGLI